MSLMLAPRLKLCLAYSLLNTSPHLLTLSEKKSDRDILFLH